MINGLPPPPTHWTSIHVQASLGHNPAYNLAHFVSCPMPIHAIVSLVWAARVGRIMWSRGTLEMGIKLYKSKQIEFLYALSSLPF